MVVIVNGRRIVMLSRWNGWEMKCACLQGNPLCECYKECKEIEVTIKPYEYIEECLRNQRKYKRFNRALRQK